MKASEVRQKYLEFMKSKGHVQIAPAALVLENDPTTLFTGSGMQPLMPYLLGKKHVGLYKALYGIFTFIGCINPPKIIWTIADICNGLMAIPNLFAINCLGKDVEYLK